MQDVATRWGSTYKMIERILEQQQAICAVLAEDRKNWYRMPSDQEISCLEAVVTVLKPLSNFTDALSGESCITISAVRPLLQHITDGILAETTSDCLIVKEMKEIIANDIKARYSDCGIAAIIDKSSYLDPRFCLEHVCNRDATLEQIKTEAVTIAAKLGHSRRNELCAEETPPPVKKTKGLGSILKQALTQSSTDLYDDSDHVQMELDRYRDLPNVDIDEDPLAWWKNQDLPILSTLAKKYLCIPGTSVPSERLFSQAGYIVNELRSRLTPDHVNMLVFLARNMK